MREPLLVGYLYCYLLKSVDDEVFCSYKIGLRSLSQVPDLGRSFGGSHCRPPGVALSGRPLRPDLGPLALSGDTHRPNDNSATFCVEGNT